MGKRNKILALVLCVLIAGVMVVGAIGTGAWFTDQEKVTGNSITAGMIDLTIGQSESLPMVISNAKPGDNGSMTVTLNSDEDSIDAFLDIKIANFTQAENGLVEPETANGDYENGGDLWIFLGFTAYLDVNKNGTFDTGDIQLTYDGQQRAYPGFWSGDFHAANINSFRNGPWTDIIKMEGGDSVNLVLSWNFPTESPDANYQDEIAMTDSMAFDLVFDLGQ